MKAQKFFVPKHGKDAIRIERDELPQFYPILHYHEEVQVTLIKKGRGILFAGAGFIDFNPGDIFILGSNLPHVFKNTSNIRGVLAISIYFAPLFGGKGFWNIEETRDIFTFLEKTRGGIKISEALQTNEFALLIETLQNASPAKRLILLLDFLNQIAETKFMAISGISFENPPGQGQTQRMDEVIDYISRNYHRRINLQEISAKAYMSPEAFCRFFRKKTRKTFTRYLNEVRISHAIRLLMDSDKAVSEIAYVCGFRNISNFNRQFLKISGKRPHEVRQIN